MYIMSEHPKQQDQMSVNSTMLFVLTLCNVRQMGHFIYFIFSSNFKQLYL